MDETNQRPSPAGIGRGATSEHFDGLDSSTGGSLLQAALEHVRRGWRVFPAKRDKKPLIEEWQHRATTDEEQIRKWWIRWPDANVAIATGKGSGIFVLDIDVKNEVNGLEALQDLEDQNGPLPDTVEVLTPSGGGHRYLGYPENEAVHNSTGKLARGLDIRGEGGYVVAPPSLTPEGEYVFEVKHHPDDVPVAEAPRWLLEKLQTTDCVSRNGNHSESQEKVREGTRNDTLTREAGRLRRLGFSCHVLEAALQALNRERCEPPLEGSEVKTIAESVGRYKPAGRNSENTEQTRTKPLTDAVLDYDALLQEHLPERVHLLDWLTERSTTMIFGPRGLGKTMLLLGIASAVTTTSPFLAWHAQTAEGVLYVDGEMPLDLLQTRAASLLQRPPRASFKFLTSDVTYNRLHRDLTLKAEDTREEITSILDASPEIKLLILDNISTLFTGLDEDKKRDWEPIAAWLIRLRHRGIATILAHHSGKTGQQRGTSGREDALDTVIQLVEPPDHSAEKGCRFELHFTKCRAVYGEAVAPLDVSLIETPRGLEWRWAKLEKSREEQVRELLDDGVTGLGDIAEALGVSRATACRLKKRVEENNQ